MKICPGCKRYYADDAQVFCLEDGIQLDLVADPNATFQMPAARETDPPATLILPADSLSDQTRMAGPVPPTMPAGTAPAANYRPAPPPGGQMSGSILGGHGVGLAAPPKKNTALVAAVAVLAVVVLGLGGALIFILTRSSGKTSGKPNIDIDVRAPGVNGRTPSGNSDAGNANTGGGPASNTNTGADGGNDSAWLQGAWGGSGTQYDGTVWTFTYVNANGKHTVEYPSVGCGGRWEPIKITATEATFTEIITHGKTCISNGRVVVTETADGDLNMKWYYVGDIIGATAIVRRE